MSIDLQTVYGGQIVRSVLDNRPAMLPKEADTVAFNRLFQRLAEPKIAFELLRTKGYGKRNTTIAEVSRVVPENGERLVRESGYDDPARLP